MKLLRAVVYKVIPVILSLFSVIAGFFAIRYGNPKIEMLLLIAITVTTSASLYFMGTRKARFAFYLAVTLSLAASLTLIIRLAITQTPR